jgi:thiopeptide-type bacteriocin biosynthesis protein
MTSTTPAAAADVRWRALHVYVHDGAAQMEQLLTATIYPWVVAARDRGAVKSWFMVRYWEGGPHLRVRLRDADDAAVADLRDQVTAFLREQPVADPPLDPVAYYRAAAGPGATLDQPPWHADHSVVDYPYIPETTRYGGPHGMAVCEDEFAASSEIAVATIRAAPSRSKRLRAAADLLLASVWATGMSWPGTVEWLRGYACSWGTVTEAPPVDVASLRRAAEAAYLRDEQRWLSHRARVREAIGVPHTAVGTWYARQEATWARLTGLHRAGDLTIPPVAVFQSLVHMTHNRLGLRLDEEAYLAWLLSMTLVTHERRESFFTDGPEAPDRRLHEHSKFVLARIAEQRPDQDAGTEGRQWFWPPSQTVALAVPSPGAAGPPLPEVLLARRSAYGRYTGPVGLDELATLLYYAASSTGESTVPGTELTYRVRTYPSGGARYPVRLLLYCHDVTGLTRGTYLYDAEQHTLGRLSTRDLSAELLETSPFLDPRESPPIDAARCPLWILMVVDLTYQRQRYGLRSYRLVLVEAGHLAQNLSLTATWLGLSCIGIGGFYDDAVNQAVSVDGLNSSVLYVYLAGHLQPLAAGPSDRGDGE